MPRISEFYGIVIYMYWFDTKRHKQPHIHAIYNYQQAVFDFDGNCLAGTVGSRASRLVSEFITERKTELMVAWELAIQGKEVPWIKPIY